MQQSCVLIQILDNVFGHVLTAVLCVSGGSVAYGDEIANGDVKVDVSSTLAPALEAKPTIYARYNDKSRPYIIPF